MISEGLCNTEDRSNGCWKLFAITGIKDILKDIKNKCYFKLQQYFTILLFLLNKSLL